ncbi:MAG: TIGR03905 family TSCPD domain-containing protein [Treponema sp.]|nr:TIGR03905 family TSCPD domain-containing protein [Spirochaetia bacterium]MDY2838835.1 TIGR03905 family TSCPD domain-containing protein [Treponema sp.]MDY5122638.1 TIGR03905 family TSCPD domain-containing protein [Treponema sp.]
MKVDYKTKGTCASMIHFTKNDDGTITDISFDGGCNGNLKAIGILCNGMKAEEIAAKLAGNKCGFKQTSCADQLAKAVLSNA